MSEIDKLVLEEFGPKGDLTAISREDFRAALTRAAEGRWVNLEHQIYLELCNTDWPDDWAKDGCTPELYNARKIVALLKGGGWIPVSEAGNYYMPWTDEPVLIAYKSQRNHRAELARYSGGEWRFLSKDETKLQERVTHWQPLPTPPTD